MSVRRDIENAITRALERVPSIAKVCPYNGEADREDALEGVKRVLHGKLPGVLVRVPDSRSETLSTSRRVAQRIYDIELFIAASSLRGREETTRNDVVGGPAGAYEVLDAIDAALQGAQLDAEGVGRVTNVSQELVVHQPDLTLYRALLSVPADFRGPEKETGREITTIRAEHNLIENDDGTGDEANPVVTADSTEDS